jgi:hypothetical protein
MSSRKHADALRLRHKELSHANLREVDFEVSRGPSSEREDSKVENTIEVMHGSRRCTVLMDHS